MTRAALKTPYKKHGRKVTNEDLDRLGLFMARKGLTITYIWWAFKNFDTIKEELDLDTTWPSPKTLMRSDVLDYYREMHTDKKKEKDNPPRPKPQKDKPCNIPPNKGFYYHLVLTAFSSGNMEGLKRIIKNHGKEKEEWRAALERLAPRFGYDVKILLEELCL